MSLADRDYMREPRPARERYERYERWLPPSSSFTPVAVWTLIALNVAVYLFGGRLSYELGVLQPRAVVLGQVWRLWTATYLHAGFWHLTFNMLGLYFLGPLLERAWGPARFLLLYTLGGVVANVLIVIAGAVGYLPYELLGLGASGSVLTVIGAVAATWPRQRIYLFGVLPLTLASFAVGYGALFVFNLAQQGFNYGGDLAHLTGLLIGAGWALAARRRRRVAERY